MDNDLPQLPEGCHNAQFNIVLQQCPEDIIDFMLRKRRHRSTRDVVTGSLIKYLEVVRVEFIFIETLSLDFRQPVTLDGNDAASTTRSNKPLHVGRVALFRSVEGDPGAVPR